MSIKKGTGLNQIAQEISDAHIARYGVDKRDPTNTVSSIIVKTEERYWQLHPNSKKSDGDICSAPIFDWISKSIIKMIDSEK